MERLTAVEGRVLGCLIEKQLTTPQQYPLTLNALALACNQTSNRDPVVVYTDEEVSAALESLKSRRLARFVLPSHGRSVVRYRQVLDEAMGLDVRGLALIALLLLRGPQTLGELRLRAERMADFLSLAEVEHELERLAGLDDPAVERLPRRPGQKEERWRGLLAAPVPSPAAEVRAADGGSSSPRPPASLVVDDGPPEMGGTPGEPRDVLSAVRAELAELGVAVESVRAELTALHNEFDELDLAWAADRMLQAR